MTAQRDPMRITSPTLHATIWLTIFVFAGLVAMACIFRVEVVARGDGKMVPLSRVQVVQPEFDGKITAINVRNGSIVQAGDVLIELDKTDAEADLNTLNSEITRLKIERARINAFDAGIGRFDSEGENFGSSTVAAFQSADLPDVAFFAEQQQLLAAETAALRTSLQKIDASVTANTKSADVTKANISRIEAALEIQGERLDVAQGLLASGSSSRSSFLDVQDTFTALQQEREVYLRELDQKMSHEVALVADQRSLLSNTRNELLQRRSEIEAREATLRQEQRSAVRRLASADLKAPLGGTVDQLDVFTIGAVASAGKELLRIVPQDQQIEFEAVFKNQDIGFIEIGQTANIKMDAFPSERFGFVRGTVTDISADAIEVSEAQWGYVLRVAPENGSLTVEGNDYLLKPGMTATADITTDDRRIISYFFAPIVDVIQDAMGER